MGGIVWLAIIGLQFLHFNHIRKNVKGYYWQFFIRVGLSEIATLPFLVAGILLVAGQDTSAIYWPVPANGFSLPVALYNAWNLLNEINR